MTDQELDTLAGQSLLYVAAVATSLPKPERVLFWKKIATMVLTSGTVFAGEQPTGKFEQANATQWMTEVMDVAKNDIKFILEHPELR